MPHKQKPTLTGRRLKKYLLLYLFLAVVGVAAAEACFSFSPQAAFHCLLAFTLLLGTILYFGRHCRIPRRIVSTIRYSNRCDHMRAEGHCPRHGHGVGVIELRERPFDPTIEDSPLIPAPFCIQCGAFVSQPIAMVLAHEPVQI